MYSQSRDTSEGPAEMIHGHPCFYCDRVQVQRSWELPAKKKLYIVCGFALTPCQMLHLRLKHLIRTPNYSFQQEHYLLFDTQRVGISGRCDPLKKLSLEQIDARIRPAPRHKEWSFRPVGHVGIEHTNHVTSHIRIDTEPVTMITALADCLASITLMTVIERDHIWIRRERTLVFVLYLNRCPRKHEAIILRRP